MLQDRLFSSLKRCFTILALGAMLVPTTWAGPKTGAPKFKVLYNFKGGTDAAAPTAGVILGKDGSLYGTAGGSTSYGTVYKLTPHPDGEWTETVLHRWQEFGENIWGGLVADPTGNLYATTAGGGTYDDGTVFELVRAARWREQVLYNFGGDRNGGGAPHWGLLREKSGDLFGLAGYPFEFFLGSDDRWHGRVLYRFHPVSGVDGTDGFEPVGTLISDMATNLYGATMFGGNYSLCEGSGGCGVVYELARLRDGKWKESVLHRFALFTNDGQYPFAGLVMDPEGSLYGTTIQGGNVRNDSRCQAGCGIVFKLAPGSKGDWKESILYNFCHAKECADGAAPETTLVFDRGGNLYGVSAGGIGPCDNGCGVVFRLSPAAKGKWTYHVLHRFSWTDGADPAPQAGLTMDENGNLYGTTFTGGKYGYGVVYEIAP